MGGSEEITKILAIPRENTRGLKIDAGYAGQICVSLPNLGSEKYLGRKKKLGDPRHVPSVQHRGCTSHG